MPKVRSNLPSALVNCHPRSLTPLLPSAPPVLGGDPWGQLVGETEVSWVWSLKQMDMCVKMAH